MDWTAPTAGQKALIRSEGQATTLALIFPETPAVFKARLNDATPDTDMVGTLDYDGVTLGSHSDILPGMTLLVGSAEGLADKGVARIRRACTASKIYIGEESEIDFADNDYLTVLDDFSIWQRHLRIVKSVIKMDYAIPYAGQNYDFLPVVVMGPDVVMRRTGESVTMHFDASDSWCPGSAVVTFAWSVSGTATITGESTATPTITCADDGTYRVTCMATANNGQSNTGYRKLVVWSDESAVLLSGRDFALRSCGARDDGWQFGVDIYGGVDLSSLRDHAQVFLVAADEYYGDTPGSLGPLEDREQVKVMGWLIGATLQVDYNGGGASFEAAGPHYWLSQQEAFPLGLRNVKKTPVRWTDVKNLTIDKLLAHFLVWRTTAATVVDCYRTGDNRRASALEAQRGTAWEQISGICQSAILATPRANRYGQIRIEIDPQYVSSLIRATIPTIIDLTADDWEGTLDIERITPAPVSQINLSGVAFDGSKAKAYFSLAPGHVHRRHGAIETIDRLLLGSQAQANSLAGLVFGQRNNLLPIIPLPLLQNNPFLDISPRQYVDVTIAAEDNPLGLAYSGRAVVRAVECEHDPSGAFLTRIEAEAETFASLYVTGDFADGDATPPVPPPVIPPFVYDPPLPPEWPPIPAIVTNVKKVVLLTVSYGVWYTENFDADEPNWGSMNSGLTRDENYGAIDAIAVTPAGRIYAWANYKTEIYAAQFGFPYFFLAFGANWWAAEFPDKTDLSFVAFGIDPAAADSLALFAGSGYVGSREIYLYLGNYDGLARKTPVAWQANAGGNLSLGGGEWLATCTGFAGWNYWARISADGDSLLDEHLFDSTGGYWHKRGGGSGAVLFGGTGAGELGYSSDNMATRELKSFSMLDLVGDLGPDGLHILALSTAGTLQRSADGGDTWETLPAPPTDISIGVIRSVNNDEWIMAGRTLSGPPFAPLIYYTNDFGDTWVDKTGDLGDFIPTEDGVVNPAAKQVGFL